MSIHDLKMDSIQGSSVDFSDFKGKTCLAVNVASRCGFTKQYAGLQELHDQYKDRGFTVLGFPCNQFGGQEPGTDESICEFAQDRFGVEFPMFSKIEVNGSNACELYKLLTSSIPGPSGRADIRWNFTKFLIDADGNVVERFETNVSPREIGEKLRTMLT